MRAPQASITTRHGGASERNTRNFSRESFLPNTGLPSAVAPWSWKLLFDISMPMMLIRSTDASFGSNAPHVRSFLVLMTPSDGGVHPIASGDRASSPTTTVSRPVGTFAVTRTAFSTAGDTSTPRSIRRGWAIHRPAGRNPSISWKGRRSLLGGQRAPGDWEASNQRRIAVHALENGTTDVGVYMIRRMLSAAVGRDAKPGGGLPGDGRMTEGEKLSAHGYDAVVRAPVKPGRDDREFVKDVGRKVFDVILERDHQPSAQRTSWVREQLSRMSL